MRTLLLLVLLGSTAAADPKVDETKIVVQKLAFEAYPQWAMAHPDKACPRS